MEKHIEVVLYFKESVLKEIEDYIDYQKMKVINYDGEYQHRSLEEFIVGCVCHYLRVLKKQNHLTQYHSLSKPTKIQNRIKEYLEEINMTQTQLSEKTQISPSNISLICKNRNQPSLDYFFRIWAALGYPTLDKLFYRVEE